MQDLNQASTRQTSSPAEKVLERESEAVLLSIKDQGRATVETRGGVGLTAESGTPPYNYRT